MLTVPTAKPGPWLDQALARGLIQPAELNRIAGHASNPNGYRPEAVVEVSLPPSVNNLFLTRGNRRVKSSSYRKWLAQAVPVLGRLAMPTRFPVEVVVLAVGALNPARDLDNFLKPIGDALVAAGALPGDSVKHVQAWRVRWAPGDGEAAVRVSLVELLEGGGA